VTAVVLEVPGRPVPKGRPRVYGGRAITPKRTREYEATVAAECLRQRVTLPDGPLWVSIVARWSRPARRPAAVDAEAWATGERLPRPSTPDVDNIAKAILDGLQRGPLDDDARVTRLEVRTVYAAQGEPCGVTVTIGRDELDGGA